MSATKPYGAIQKGYVPSNSIPNCDEVVCATPQTTTSGIVIHTCDTVHESIHTPVFYQDKYYLSIAPGATGDPSSSENSDNWLGGFETMGELICQIVDSKTESNLTIKANPAGGFNIVDSNANVVGTI